MSDDLKQKQQEPSEESQTATKDAEQVAFQEQAQSQTDSLSEAYPQENSRQGPHSSQIFCGICGFMGTSEMASLTQYIVPFFILGIFLMSLGTLAICSACLATLLTVAVFGFLLLTGGIALTINSFYSDKWSGFLLYLFLGILYILMGFLLFDRPGEEAIALTLLLALFFIASGLFRIFGAFALRCPGWEWILCNGIVTFLLGVLIYKQWPFSGLWVIGFFVGIDLLLCGWYWLLFALSLKSFVKNR